MNKDNLDILSKIIKERRSTFTPMFTGEKVEQALIHQMLENANWAPNHRNTEPWRFYVIQEKALQRLSDYQKEFYLKNTPAEKQSERKLRKTINNALRSSHVIAICMKRDENAAVPEWEELAAVSCAVQNMWLTASAAGVGAYWSTPKNALEANEFLNLSQGERCLGWFYVGVPQAGIPYNPARGAIDQKLKWINH